MANKKVLTYQQSGVNYSLMDPFKNACLKIAGKSPELIEYPDFFIMDLIEGLGSLNKLADDIYQKTGQDFYYQAGWGNAASILNDLASSGAKPQTIKIFVAAGGENWYANTPRWKKLIKGFNDAAKYCLCQWNGGETQTLVNLVDKDSVVLAGSAMGIISPKSYLLTEDKLENEDRIILLQSSGFHTNGITLIRTLFKNDPSWAIQAIKPKTLLYSPLIQEILKQNLKLHYASPITGHGWRKIMRSKRSFTYLIEKINKPQPIFNKIQEMTNMTTAQMYSDYNMGIGLALFAPEKSVSEIIKIALKYKIKAFDAGLIKSGPRKVLIKPLNIEFSGNDLQIR